MKCTVKPNLSLVDLLNWLYMFAEVEWGVSELWNLAALDRGLH